MSKKMCKLKPLVKIFLIFLLMLMIILTIIVNTTKLSTTKNQIPNIKDTEELKE